MESLTQITLGAAVGEVVLGRKIGNRALLWGGIGGTIPDLDIIAGFVTDNLSSTAFHRGITHSAFFAVGASVALGWLLHSIYDSERHSTRALLQRWIGVYLWLLVLIGVGTIVLPIPKADVLPVILVTTSVIMLFPLIALFWRKQRGQVESIRPPSLPNWMWFFFWVIITHPLLDTCTTFGTQLLLPFSDWRASIGNISSADPAYSVPFFLCVATAAFFTRQHPRRRLFNWLGIGLSCAYLLFTLYHKVQVNAIFEDSLQAQKIEYRRYMNSPTILNNILWQGVAESDTAYHFGMYSFLDKKAEIQQFSTIPKNHELLAPYQDERAIEILTWFSNGYYSVMQLDSSRLQFNDLRYGSFDQSFDEPKDYIFKYVLEEENGQLVVRRSQEVGNIPEALRKLWERLKGINGIE